MTFTVLIPARLQASRLPDKPLADIGGLPMVVRVARMAARSSATRVVVAADHARILAACAAHGVEALATAASHPSGSDRLAEAATLLGLPDDAIVLNVQGDEPLLEPALIDAVAQLLVDRPEAAISTAAHPIDSVADFLSPNVVKVVLDQRGLALNFSRAPIPHWRDAPAADPAGTFDFSRRPAPAPLRHIGLYGYRVGFLRRFPTLPPAPLEQCEALEQLRALWHGFPIAVYITSEAPGAGVDTPADLARVRALFD